MDTDVAVVEPSEETQVVEDTRFVKIQKIKNGALVGSLGGPPAGLGLLDGQLGRSVRLVLPKVLGLPNVL